MSERSNVYFILVRPVFLGNIGGAARVLKNFGFRNLRLVGAPRDYKNAEARQMAVSAFDVLKAAELFDSLSDALQDIALVVGTTSAQQRVLDPVPLRSMLPKLNAVAADNKIAIVFGDERNGLDNDDLKRCHQVITIPTDPSFPALNIVLAIGIAAYELSQTMAPVAMKAPNTVAHPSGGDDDELFQQLDALLHAAEFSRTFNRTKVLAELRTFYQRAHPTAREASLLKGAIIRLNAKLKE